MLLYFTLEAITQGNYIIPEILANLYFTFAKTIFSVVVPANNPIIGDFLKFLPTQMTLSLTVCTGQDDLLPFFLYSLSGHLYFIFSMIKSNISCK